jgi:hypothetical protein
MLLAKEALIPMLPPALVHQTAMFVLLRAYASVIVSSRFSFFLVLLDSDHSCADVTLTGSKSLSDYPFDSQPTDWPYASMKMQYYGAEVGEWSNAWLSGIPSNYTTDYGTLTC